MAVTVSPVFMLILGLVYAAAHPAETASTLAGYLDTLPSMPLFGLIPGVPVAIGYAALLSHLARRGWDALGVSLVTGAALAPLLEIAFITIAMPEAGTGANEWTFFWNVLLLLVPFAGTGSLICAIYWRMVIRHQRLARLAAKQAADAIRTME